MKLYELTSEIQNAIELYNQVETDDQLAEVEVKLESLQIDFKEKVVGVAKYVRNVEADATAIDNEIKRLQTLKKRAERTVEWFERYLFQAMEATSTEKVECPILKVSIRKNPPSVQVEDESKIPEKYWRIIPETKEVDKNAIKDAFKAGIGVDGAKVIQTKRIEIK